MCNRHKLTTRNPRCRIQCRHHRTRNGLDMLDGGKGTISIGLERGNTAIGSIDTLIQTVEDIPVTVKHQPGGTGTAVGGLGNDRQMTSAITGWFQRQ